MDVPGLPEDMDQSKFHVLQSGYSPIRCALTNQLIVVVITFLCWTSGLLSAFVNLSLMFSKVKWGKPDQKNPQWEKLLVEEIFRENLKTSRKIAAPEDSS